VKMKAALVILLFVALCEAHLSEYHSQFLSFKSKFSKTYLNDEEELHRLQVFKDNLEKIYDHNNNSGSTYKMGINQFSDLTEDEFVSLHLGGYKRTPIHTGSGQQAPATYSTKDLPESVDWREKGAMTPVKDQGACGSCWAFTVTEIIEAYLQIGTGELHELSAQQVTSCTPNPSQCGGTGGCKGAVVQLGYSYLQLFGHVSESAYPYVSGETQATEDCLYAEMEGDFWAVAGITGYNNLPSNNQEAAMQHLANVGPLGIALDASKFHMYESGVFDGCPFDENISINHGVVLVGYGTDPELGDYWLIRNSWSESYGEEGYIRVKRMAEEGCGVDSTPMDGTACVGGPGTDMQNVCGRCGMLFDLSYVLGAYLVQHD